MSTKRTTISDPRFLGKVIVITGAGGNFGRSGCLYFTSRGAKVIALDLNETALNETISEVETNLLTLNGPNEVDDDAIIIKAVPCNVTKIESVDAAMDCALETFGRIDMVWNNAGYQGQIKPTLEYDPVDFANVMSINVTGMFIVMQSAAKRMVQSCKKEEDGTLSKGNFSIVNTASVAGLRGTPAMVAYSSSKAAVLAMTVSSAKDLAPYGIRVNAISPALIGPGFMWTRQNELHAASGSPYFSTDPDQVAKNKVNGVPMKRLGSIMEVIQSVAFLLSDDASYTTATNLVIDGGMSGGLKA